MNNFVGMDLGTRYSVVTYINANSSPETIPTEYKHAMAPSAVYLSGSMSVVGENAKEYSTGLRKDRLFPYPIAIVVTKVDALNLEFEIGSFAAQNLLNTVNSITSEGDAINLLLWIFLCQNDLDHFVRDIEMHFSKARYLPWSAHGHMPVQSNNRSFVIVCVRGRLIWLLARAKQYGLFRRTSMPHAYSISNVNDAIPA